MFVDTLVVHAQGDMFWHDTTWHVQVPLSGPENQLLLIVFFVFLGTL